MYRILDLLLLLTFGLLLLRLFCPSLFVFFYLYRLGWRRMKWGDRYFLIKKFNTVLTYYAENLNSAVKAEQVYGNQSKKH